MANEAEPRAECRKKDKIKLPKRRICSEVEVCQCEGTTCLTLNRDGVVVASGMAGDGERKLERVVVTHLVVV